MFRPPSYSDKINNLNEKNINFNLKSPTPPPLTNKVINDKLKRKTNIITSPLMLSTINECDKFPTTSNIHLHSSLKNESTSPLLHPNKLNQLPPPISPSPSSTSSIFSTDTLSPLPPRRRLSTVEEIDSCLTLLPDKVGEGAFGIVHLGQIKESKQNVAIKCVKKEKLRTGEIKDSIINEANIHLNIDNPRIVHLYDAIETDDCYYFVMDEVKGYNLSDRFNITCDYPITEDEACHYTYEILEALDYLHNLNIIHCDLKPENILLERKKPCLPNDYMNYNVKLCDFGLSCKIPNAPIKSKANYIHLKSTQGTMGYMAPEMFTQKKGTTSSDIWSVGILLFKMLFDYDPFYPYSSCATTDLEYDEYACSDVSPEAKNVIDHMLVREPFGRSSAKELLKMKWFEKERETQKKV